MDISFEGLKVMVIDDWRAIYKLIFSLLECLSAQLAKRY